MMTLGERIRQERERRDISQVELARRIGVSKNTMNMSEESKIADPRFSRVLAIAQQLGMSLDTLDTWGSPTAPRQTTWTEDISSGRMTMRCSGDFHAGVPCTITAVMRKTTHDAAIFRPSYPEFSLCLSGKALGA